MPPKSAGKKPAVKSPKATVTRQQLADADAARYDSGAGAASSGPEGVSSGEDDDDRSLLAGLVPQPAVGTENLSGKEVLDRVPTCARVGCTKTCYVQDNGRVEDYCGRTCAIKDGKLAPSPDQGVTAATQELLLARIAALEQRIQSAPAPSYAGGGRPSAAIGSGPIEEMEDDVLRDFTHHSAAEGFVEYPGNPCRRGGPGAPLPPEWQTLLYGPGTKHTKRDINEVTLLHPMASIGYDVCMLLGDLADSGASKAEMVHALGEARDVIHDEILQRIWTRMDILRQAPTDREFYERTIDPRAITHQRGPAPLTAGGRELDERVAANLVRNALRKATGEKDDDTDAKAKVASFLAARDKPRAGAVGKPQLPMRGGMRPRATSSGPQKSQGSAAAAK